MSHWRQVPSTQKPALRLLTWCCCPAVARHGPKLYTQEIPECLVGPDGWFLDICGHCQGRAGLAVVDQHEWLHRRRQQQYLRRSWMEVSDGGIWWSHCWLNETASALFCCLLESRRASHAVSLHILLTLQPQKQQNKEQPKQPRTKCEPKNQNPQRAQKGSNCNAYAENLAENSWLKWDRFKKPRIVEHLVIKAEAQ